MGAVLPGVASAGVTELTGNPLLGAAAAIASPFMAARAVTPVMTRPGRDAATALLHEEGVPLTAGQRTGSRPLQWIESTTGDSVGAGAAGTGAIERQQAQFTRAAAERMGVQGAEQITPEVFQETRRRVGGEFRDLSARHNLDAQVGGLQNRITDIMRDHVPDMTPENQRRFIGIITDRLAPNIHQGQMPGQRYQALRSSLGNIAQGASRGQDQPFALGVRGLRNALDDAMDASIQATGNPGDVARWGAAREQWGAMRTLEDVMNTAGPATAQGFVSPAQLRSAVARRNPIGFAQGQNELGELGRAGVAAMSPLPQSGTAPREAVRALSSVLGAGLGMGAAGTEGALAGALGAAAAPAVVGRAVMSAPIQAWLGNQIFRHNPDTRIQALLRSIGRGRAAARHEVEER
jgi:hypothetical protein